jgi:Rod binding domain-containing protein
MQPVIGSGTGWNAMDLKTPQNPSGRNLGEVAAEFEAVLIQQLLATMRSDAGGWMGAGGDGASSSVIEFAEQQVASALARGGGLGLADLITKGLRQKLAEPPANPGTITPDS